MFKLQSPIPKQYKNKNGEYEITQLFGENKAPFYKELGLPGHNGLDFKTKFWSKYILGMIGRFDTDPNEKLGIVQVLAAHDGYLQMPKNTDRTRGIYQKILSPEYFEDGKYFKIETVYFHLDKVRRYVGDGIDENDFVRAGSVIGYSGNTGQYTTGAHLHFGVRVWYKQPDGTWDYCHNAYDGYIDPMKFLNINYKIV